MVWGEGNYRTDGVLVVVGPDNQVTTFLMRQELLAKAGAIIPSAAQEDLLARTGKFSVLKNVEPDHFNLYMNWLNVSIIPPRNRADEYAVLSKLCILGTQIQDWRFQDAVIDALIDKFKNSIVPLPDATTINEIFNGPIQSQALQRLVVGMYARRPAKIASLTDSLVAEFWQALAQSLAAKAGPPSEEFSEEEVATIKRSGDPLESDTKRRKTERSSVGDEYTTSTRTATDRKTGREMHEARRHAEDVLQSPALAKAQLRRTYLRRRPITFSLARFPLLTCLLSAAEQPSPFQIPRKSQQQTNQAKFLRIHLRTRSHPLGTHRANTPTKRKENDPEYQSMQERRGMKEAAYPTSPSR
ncbi:Hypothetical predicted protein [Lecanosticta acicola]|uniref:BTB domain-containing protein n=1 Tax=Lecanosticta acicola TaxID=111012 RepID=A0AAI8Z1J2_9PEZI|nr:Hypothetical predicted protein [Lecanosticta acicola]